MRVALLMIGLLALGACVQPPPSPMAQNTAPKSDLNRFVEPTNGAAYSQSDMYYYRDNSSTGYQGPSGVLRMK